MIYLELSEVLELHRRLIMQSGGLPGVRDLGGLQSALAQPQLTFAGVELYPTLVDKAVALAYSLVLNHPFHDANKRVGHAAMEAFLVLNGHELQASVDEQEAVMLQLAAGTMDRASCAQWVGNHVAKRNG